METRNRTAFITGSGRRLGRRIALALAADGWDIVLHAHTSTDGIRRTADALRAAGTRVHAVRADLSSADEALRAGHEAVAAFGVLDLLVNNAAIFPTRAFMDVDPALWDSVMNTNLRQVFFVTQACAPALRAAGGSVVNIASAGGMQPWITHIPYNVSKAGVLMLTRALAKELAPDVRVNAIAPGIVLMDGEEAGPPALPEDRVPLHRHATAEDITSIIRFLTTDGRQFTGHVFSPDGGLLTTGGSTPV